MALMNYDQALVIEETLRKSGAYDLKKSSKSVPRTHCMRGHLFDEVNTAFNSRGAKSCKLCSAANKARVKEQREQYRKLESERKISRDGKLI